jgi:hypothetical protein
LGTDSIGIYEELERIQGLAPACQLTSLSFPELQHFLRITAAIGRSPRAVFYITAYQMAKHHARDQILRARRDSQEDPFLLFERRLLRRRLIDHGTLALELSALADRFDEHYGGRFSLD